MPTNEQTENQVFIEVTLPRLRKMCEWYKEDKGTETTWMSMLISCVDVVFDSIYQGRKMFDEEKNKES